jgi:formylglycine-generating enzyme required for sulfatase activity
LTQAQWTAVMGTTPWVGHPNVVEAPNNPAVYISWDDVQLFLAEVNAFLGSPGGFQLPSESQWEYAARATTTTRFYWGDDLTYSLIVDNAWCADNCSTEQYAHEGGLKTANGDELFDISGNVAEWCADDWHGSYTGAPLDGTAWVDTPRSTNRMVRGGSWDSPGSKCRSAARDNWSSNYAFDDLGVRLVRIPR